MGKRKTFSKGISWLLTCAMVVSVIPSSIGMTAVKAAEPDLSTMLTDLVEVQLGDETKTMQLYAGGYECKFTPDGSAETESESGGKEEASFEETVAEVDSTIGEETPDSVSEDSVPQTDADADDEKEQEEDKDTTPDVDTEADDTDSVEPESEADEEDEELEADEEEFEAEAAVEMTAALKINGETVATEKVTVGDEAVYFRLSDGEFTNSTDEGWVKSVAFVGNFTGLSFKDEEGQAYEIVNWAPADENAELTYLGGGIWARTFLFEELAADASIEYKVAANDAWGVDWGDGADNVALTIPAGTSELTVYADEMSRKVYDSVRTETFTVGKGSDGSTCTLVPFKDTVSLIGTARGGDDDWELTKKGYEFTQISDRYWLTQKTLDTGKYAWKVAYNYSDWSKFADKAIEVAADKTNVIFLYDAEEDKIYDSINDKTELGEILGLATAAAKQEVIRNANDTLKFVCSPTVSENALAVEKVELVYGVYNETDKTVKSPTEVTLTKNSDGSFSSNFLYFGDDKQTIAYYYKIDGVKTLDDSAAKTVTDSGSNEWSGYEKPEFEGRIVSLPGTLNGNGWAPAKESEMLTYKGNGIYEITVADVAPGNYQYKIAIDGSWDENYGAKGEQDGANMNLTVTELSDVKFTYSDISHLTVNSVDYIFADIALSGTGIPKDTKLTDDMLRGIYSVTVDMNAGTYSDIAYSYDGKTYDVSKIELSQNKAVTFYFDPVTLIYYNDASDVKVDTQKIFYDSKDVEYKDPYGAIEKDHDVTFQINTGDDAEWVKLVIKGIKNKTIDMESVSGNSASGNSAASGKKWSVTTSFDAIGEYHYYFAISNGSAVSVYSDDESMNYGTGMSTDLLNAVPYDFIVCESGFETPDWMKNAVIYQIFPDRFCNGDTSNDFAQTTSRGALDYEFPTDWYTLPENPEMENVEGYAATGAWVGDGEWSNEMYGGDIKGITDRIDYLHALGVTVIYLNPVCASISSHRYDATDYMKLDPILGDIGDFEELVAAAEERDMHIILDGVFNHVSDDSVYFDRYYKFLEKGTTKIGAYPYWAYVYDAMAADNSLTLAAAETNAKEYFTSRYGITDFSYTEWFNVYQNETLKDDDGNVVKDTIGQRAGKPVYGYEGWWGYDSMPVIASTNGSEYQTGNWKDEIIGQDTADDGDVTSVTKYWLQKGSDGWRLDVANEVSDETWQHFRKSVKALDSDNVIVGEIWTDAAEYLLGDMYDSVMNYMFRNAVTSYVMGGDASDSTDVLERLRERYPSEAFYAMMNLVASHDTTRILSYLDGIADDRSDKTIAACFPTYEGTSDAAKQMQYAVAFLQMTYAGAPTIYYGDEIGMVGGDDPDDRRGMTWGKGNKDIVEWYAKMADIRSKYTALRTGAVESFSVGNEHVMAFVRSDDDATLAVMANNTADSINATVNFGELGMEDGTYVDVVSGEECTVTGGTATVAIPGYRGVILVKESGKVDVEIDADALKPAYDPAYAVPVRTVPSKPVVNPPKPQPQPSKPQPTKPAVQPKAAGTVLKSADSTYKVTSSAAANPTVEWTGVTNKKAKKATVPAAIVADGVTYKVTGIAKNALKGKTKIKKVTIGKNVKTIGNSAFQGCAALKSITIPEGVTNIGSKAFYGDKNLKKITIKSTVLKKVGSKAFKGIHAKATIKVPKKMLKKYQKTLKGKGQAKTVKIKK